jgi:hypothetical protein
MFQGNALFMSTGHFVPVGLASGGAVFEEGNSKIIHIVGYDYSRFLHRLYAFLVVTL